MTSSVRADAAARWFAEQYGRPPEGIWRAPGRVNLIGEHTDYNDGFALPLALRTGVTVCAARRSDASLKVSSRQAGSVTMALDELVPGTISGWPAYPAGMVWALRHAGHPVGGASLAIDSDLPMGAGLASSAALECAVGLAMTGLYGLAVPRLDLAALARTAENDFVGAPTGIMDPSAALFCQPGHVLLLDCRTRASTAVPLDLPADGLALMIIDTGIRHALADGRYAMRRRECEKAARAVGVPSLRDIARPEQLGEIGDPMLRRRAQHVVEENSRVLRTADLLRDQRIVDVGDVLTQSHISLRDNFDVSWPQADAAVAAAMSGGATGARMVGGGFGGSVIVLLPAIRTESVTTAVTRSFTNNEWRYPVFTSVLPSASAHRLR